MSDSHRNADSQIDEPGTVWKGEVLDGTENQGTPVRLKDSLPGSLPILVSPEGPLFPGMMSPIPIGDARTEATLNLAQTYVGVIAARPETVRDGEPVAVDQLYHVGCVGQVVKQIQLPDGRPGALVAGVHRMRVRRYIESDKVLVAELEYPVERVEDQQEVEALHARVRAGVKELVKVSPELPDQVAEVIDRIPGPGPTADFVAVNLGPDLVVKQEMLADLEIGTRLRHALLIVEKQLDIARLGAKLQAEIRSKIEAHQKEHYLREQMAAIRKELGEEVDQRQLDRETYMGRVLQAEMPAETEDRAMQELERLLLLPPEASEYHVIRNYLDWLVELPWSKLSEERLDLGRARRILDEDHYGLDEVKERIIEFLAVRKLNPARQGAILCLVGPPGVGKTSLGRSIARATGREYIRVSLGGMRDEAEIKGHRRTYIGAMPGKIIQSLKRAGARNPVFVLDELDKLGSDWRGDPSAALLEVLDPAQNGAFGDLYIDQPFDLSQVMFVATANVPSQIPGALRDRMEIIQIPGYLPAEKAQIGRRYLVPRQLEQHGLTTKHLKVTARAMTAIVDGYTREAGVRELERMLGRVCRKVAAEVATLPDGAEHRQVVLTGEDLAGFLGTQRFSHEMVQRRRVPGVATGLAWTPVGGEVLFIEATSMPGSGRLQLTGQLGDVMSESARIAFSLLKSRSEELGIPPEIFRNRDIHLHVPAGAVPKDGPSAGVAMTVALLSLLWKGKGRAVRARTAMTGEITLSGTVLPVGGLREKVIGAKRAGIKRVIVPERCRPDIDEIPEKTRRGLEFIFVNDINEAVRAAIA